MEWVKIGKVGVDSGQLMLCDPCYIDNNWVKEEFVDLRVFSDKSGKQYAYNTPAARELGSNFELFDCFESILSNGKTPNQCISNKEWVEAENKYETFSYNGVSHKDDKAYKQINYNLGHPGLAVVFSSGFGDGCYDVFAKIHRGRVYEVKVVMAEL